MARQIRRPIITRKVRPNVKTPLFCLKTGFKEKTELYTHLQFFFLSALIAIGVWWRSYLLVPGHWIHQLHIKLRVILSKRLIAVVVNQFHNWIKRQWIRKAIFSIPMVDLYQFIVATLPVKQYSHLEVFTVYLLPPSTLKLLTKTPVKFLGRYYAV